MRSFDIPHHYRSPVIAAVKAARTAADPRRRDLRPTTLDFGPVRLKIARHFGFCFGVENAIEIAYRTLEQNPGKRVYLLSEMIHNPHVNEDLVARGVQFIMTASGEQVIPWDNLNGHDIVVVPAFGTTIEIAAQLAARGIDPYRWDTTCPFVEKVWNRSVQLGARGFTVVVHGKPTHEETRATFSHSSVAGPTVVVRDMLEAERLSQLIRGEAPSSAFSEWFGTQCSPGFDPEADLRRLGVVNQTTMLATETEAIAELLRKALEQRYGAEEIASHFADTRDTLCYATNENQSATLALIESGADCAVVVGGYNSSNTSHLVELLSARFPTWFICDAREIVSSTRIRHFDLTGRRATESDGWLPQRADGPVEIAITSGASCPDALVDEVIARITGFYPDAKPLEMVMDESLRAAQAP